MGFFFRRKRGFIMIVLYVCLTYIEAGSVAAGVLVLVLY